VTRRLAATAHAARRESVEVLAADLAADVIGVAAVMAATQVPRERRPRVKADNSQTEESNGIKLLHGMRALLCEFRDVWPGMILLMPGTRPIVCETISAVTGPGCFDVRGFSPRNRPRRRKSNRLSATEKRGRESERKQELEVKKEKKIQVSRRFGEAFRFPW